MNALKKYNLADQEFIDKNELYSVLQDKQLFPEECSKLLFGPDISLDKAFCILDKDGHGKYYDADMNIVHNIFGKRVNSSDPRMPAANTQLYNGSLSPLPTSSSNNTEHRLSSLAEQRDFSTCELMTHPGYPSHRVLSGFLCGSDDFGCSDDRIHEIKILSSSEMSFTREITMKLCRIKYC